MVVEQQKIFLVALLCTTPEYLHSGHTRPPVHKQRSSFISLFRLKLRILQKLFKIFRNAKHLCFNALSDHCDCQMTTVLRVFKKVSHTMLRMAKNLSALQNIMNINNGRQNIASFISPTKRTIKSIDRCLNSRASNSRVFIGVLSKFPKLKTPVFRIAGQRFVRWIRVIRSLSNLCLNCNHCIGIISHIF